MVYDGVIYEEQYQACSRERREQKELKTPAEFLSGIKKTDKFMAVITFICYYGREEWDTPLSLKDMLVVPGPCRKITEYLSDYPIHVIPMMKIDPGVFHSEVRELIALLQCNSDMQKLEALVRSSDRYRYLSEETFETFFILSDTKDKIIKKIKESVSFAQKEKKVFDMCRAFEQLEQRGIAIGEQRGITIGEQRGEHRLNKLYSRLIDQERYEDLKTASVDEEYRRKLYEEFQLV